MSSTPGMGRGVYVARSSPHHDWTPKEGTSKSVRQNAPSQSKTYSNPSRVHPGYRREPPSVKKRGNSALRPQWTTAGHLTLPDLLCKPRRYNNFQALLASSFSRTSHKREILLLGLNSHSSFNYTTPLLDLYLPETTDDNSHAGGNTCDVLKQLLEDKPCTRLHAVPHLQYFNPQVSVIFLFCR